MPTWTTNLPPTPDRHGYDLRRTPPDHPIRAIVTSETFFVCQTHYWGGRTVPCEAPDCDACRAMSPTRAHCYLSALEAKTHDHFLFECTTKAAYPFQDYLETYHTLRGCEFVACRPKRRRNAQVEIICRPFDITKIYLPKPPNIPAAMAVIWQLPQSAIDTKPGPPANPNITADKTIIDRMRLNAADGPKAQTTVGGNGSPS